MAETLETTKGRLAANTRPRRRSAPVIGWWTGWMPLLVLPPAVLLVVPATWPRWALMWLLSVLIFAGCKWLTWRRAAKHEAPVWLHVGYLFGWPGLDAKGFLTRRTGLLKPTVAEWLFASIKSAIGLFILIGLVRLLPSDQPYLIGWLGMIGVVMTLHFGLFHLLSCAWRVIGIDAKPLMNWPLCSVSLSEFWGRRWNTAFRDLAHSFLFRPLTPRLGARGAVIAGFLFSGVVHDVVISIPAGGGYGGPTLYFVIQGIGMLVERSVVGRKLGLGQGWIGWLFAMALLAGPVPLLFHLPFVTRVVTPFLQAVGVV
ncbi:MBOAT family protein [Anatilimnocola sp. NA78]|uniref:MBOAT family protein n=1 Tax=Anatilimnocola sp. NA78 TaxID=3415683 RepID=UPI003CE5346C